MPDPIRDRVSQFVGTYATELFATATNILFGRHSAGAGKGEEIAIGETLEVVSGTINVKSSVVDISSRVPYTGATANVALGNNSLSVSGTTNTISTSGSFGFIKTTGQYGTIFTTGSGAEIYTDGEFASIRTNGTSASIQTRFNFILDNGTHLTTLSHAPTAHRAIAFPDASGTVALTSDITGAATNGTNGQALTSDGAGGFGTPVTLGTAATSNTGDFAAALGSNDNYVTDAEKTRIGYISVTQAVDLDTIESDTVTNNAKVSNATHTGEVTGSGVLTVGPTAISNKPTVTLVGTEEVLVNDAGTLKKATVQDIADMGGSDTNGTNGQALTSDGAGGFGTPVTLGTAATSNTGDFAAASHTHVSADITDADPTATPSTVVRRDAAGGAEFASTGAGNALKSQAVGTGKGLWGISSSGAGVVAFSSSGNHAEFGETGDNRGFIANAKAALGWWRGAFKGLLKAANTLTADRTWDLPDKDGTVAMTSDLGTYAPLNHTQSDTAPVSPNAGDTWTHTATGLKYEFYDGFWISNSPITDLTDIRAEIKTLRSITLLGL
jgi:hypothetical protein